MPATPLPSAREASAALARVGRHFHQRGWVFGTSGNFSVVRSRQPVRLAITASAAHKGELTARDILEIDAKGRVTRGRRPPSAETGVHLAIVAARRAGAVLHTHSIWSTILSERHRGRGGLAVRDLEMLKGLDGVTTHAHREWIPIVANTQDMPALARDITAVLAARPAAHAVLIAGHGLYTWGRTLAEAERHVEILEFLLELEGRRQSWPS
ncbi:MAG: methylthioribulose 1-phosphate dehydratase [Vicinamibacterales bacterium]